MREITASQRVASLHIAKMQKEAFFLESIKEKLFTGTMNTEAQRQSKMMSSEAKKGMRQLFGDVGINSPAKFISFMNSAKEDPKDPLSKILFRACKGKSVGEAGNIAGKFFASYYKGDIKGMAGAVDFDEKAMHVVLVHYMKDDPKFKAHVKKGEARLNKAIHARLNEVASLYVQKNFPGQKFAAEEAVKSVVFKNFSSFMDWAKVLWEKSSDASNFIDFVLCTFSENVIKGMLENASAKVEITHTISAKAVEWVFNIVGGVASWVEWALGYAAQGLGYVFTCLVDIESGKVMPYVWSTIREALQSGWAILKWAIVICFTVLKKGLVLTAGYMGPIFVLKLFAVGAVAYFIYLFMAWGNYKLAELPKVIFMDIPLWAIKKLWSLITGGDYKFEPNSQKALEKEVVKAKAKMDKTKAKENSRYTKKALSF